MTSKPGSPWYLPLIPLRARSWLTHRPALASQVLFQECFTFHEGAIILIRDYNGLEAARITQDHLRTALRKVDEFRKKLTDRGVHPDRFARWVATWPSNKYSDVVRTFAGRTTGHDGLCAYYT